MVVAGWLCECVCVCVVSVSVSELDACPLFSYQLG